jgi:hypothetical protein
MTGALVEGVEADDYSSSRALLSVLRRENKKHSRPNADIPTHYDSFSIVDHCDEISAPYSPRSFAVKIIEDNIAGWATHAATRGARWAKVSGSFAPRCFPTAVQRKLAAR